MTYDRLILSARRILAWWIDLFAVGAVVIVSRWAINLLADAPLTGTAQTTYETITLAVLFYAYRVLVEGRYRTSLGKWSLGLEIVSPYSSYTVAAIRNSWFLLTLAGIWIDPWQHLIPVLVGAGMFIWGQHPFDKLAGGIIFPRSCMC